MHSKVYRWCAVPECGNPSIKTPNKKVMSMVELLLAGPYIEGGGRKKHCHKHRVSKENQYKLKYNRRLKRKLRKYRLRRDGCEDPDIIDVSNTFQQFLKLASPNQNNSSNQNIHDCDTLRPKNYLFKMVKHNQSRKALKIANGLETENTKLKSQNVEITSESKIKKNAFQLMMDSRNKSIGSNSPGKDRTTSENESEDIIKIKKDKVKRNLALQKLAEAKGSLEKIELEKQKDENIKIKMNKRATRLKKMITTNKQSKKEERSITELSKNSSQDNIKIEETESPKIHLGIRESFLNNSVSPVKKYMSKEDIDFLNKLSPSLKKKENMMSYFKKVDKDPEPIPSENVIEDTENEIANDDTEITSIKVKFSSKRSKRSKKKKLSLLKNDDNLKTSDNISETYSPVENVVTNSAITADETNEKSADSKRKRKRNQTENVLENEMAKATNIDVTPDRPKRNVKKPVKYCDVFELSTSDEEFPKFTPKKKKQLASTDETDTKPTISKKTKEKAESKGGKLAPIFKAKPQLDPALLEAKQKFLQSGMPDQLKKIVVQHKTQDLLAGNFHSVVHVQQIPPDIEIKSEVLKLSDPHSHTELESRLANKKSFPMTKLLIPHKNVESLSIEQSNADFDIPKLLKTIKNSYKDFPVHRIYKLLSSKSNGGELSEDSNSLNVDNSLELINLIDDTKTDDPQCLSWTEKYKASAVKEIIGNFEPIRELKKWLESWKENHIVKNDSDSDFYHSDQDSRDSMRNSNNLLILSGPTGCGKTSSVYAVAAELAMKVIEVNSGSRRTGKILLQDLQEATQSHKVNRKKGSSTENSQNSQDLFGGRCYQNKKKRKKTGSQNFSQKSEGLSQSNQEGRTGISLILIDDADIIFEQDDGFISGITQLVQISKRPVILVTTSLSCSHLQKFVQCGKVIKLHSLSPRMLGTWLDIMCLADTGICWPGVGSKVLDYYFGDIRKSINCLHFIFSCERQRDCGTFNKNHIIDEQDEENSSTSWTVRVSEIVSKNNNNNMVTPGKNIWRHLLGSQNSDIYKSLDMFSIWWNVPNILKINDSETDLKDTQHSSAQLEEISDLLDNISLADSMNTEICDMHNIVSDPMWRSVVLDSVSEKDNYEEVNNCNIMCKDMCYELVTKSLDGICSRLYTTSHNINIPGHNEMRLRQKTFARHDLLTNSLSLNSMFDRKALALDYWSACRTICRTEKTRTDSNAKRNNRFFHYLKSAKVMCKNDVFAKLCDSLNTNDS